jgi:hypothetical protein
VIEVKEVKFRPNTDTHDYDVKMRNVMRFLEAGDKVKVTLRFRGREMAHQDLGRELLERVAGDVDGVGKVENMPKMEGRQMIMIIGPGPARHVGSDPDRGPLLPCEPLAAVPRRARTPRSGPGTDRPPARTRQEGSSLDRHRRFQRDALGRR